MSDRAEERRPGLDYRETTPDLAELCRIHDVSLDLIRCSDDVDELLDRILGEYERRLKEMSTETLDGAGGPLSLEEAKKLRALIMFAGHAVALKQKAAAATESRRRADELQRLNDELERALALEEQGRRRLDDVLSALDAGIIVVGERRPGPQRQPRRRGTDRHAAGATDEPIRAGAAGRRRAGQRRRGQRSRRRDERPGRAGGAAGPEQRPRRRRWCCSATSPSGTARCRNGTGWSGSPNC